jgi:hypothetical protein
MNCPKKFYRKITTDSIVLIDAFDGKLVLESNRISFLNLETFKIMENISRKAGVFFALICFME